MLELCGTEPYTLADDVSPLTAKYAYVVMTRDDRQYSIAEKIPKFFPCETLNPVLIKRKWVDGEYKEVECPLLSGYIFLYSNEQMDSTVIHRLGDVQRVLQYGDQVYALTGYGEQLARWLARYNGVIGLSKAIQVGDRIQVVQGPMKDELCKIISVDKHKRRAKVEIQFNRAAFHVLMDFEWVENSGDKAANISAS